MDKLIAKLTGKFPQLVFKPGQQFSWSPGKGEIIYKISGDKTATWSLLHETGHALLGHQRFKADMELLRLEAAAWEQACQLGRELGIKIDEDHIQDCLDTYRDWLHRRSLCPTCATSGIQQEDYAHYRCFNCRTVWRVSHNRFSRSYRRCLTVGVEPLAQNIEFVPAAGPKGQ